MEAILDRSVFEEITTRFQAMVSIVRLSAIHTPKDYDKAVLMRLPKSAFAPIEQDSPAAPAMSLETFQEQRDPNGFYSEAELLALYQEEVDAGAPVNRRAVRNVRLHQRRMAALSRLENVLVETPQLEHHVAGWFDAPIANSLAAGGLTTLAQLVDVINSAG